jgi:hypothetical protein
MRAGDNPVTIVLPRIRRGHGREKYKSDPNSTDEQFAKPGERGIQAEYSTEYFADESKLD